MNYQAWSSGLIAIYLIKMLRKLFFQVFYGYQLFALGLFFFFVLPFSPPLVIFLSSRMILVLQEQILSRHIKWVQPQHRDLSCRVTAKVHPMTSVMRNCIIFQNLVKNITEFKTYPFGFMFLQIQKPKGRGICD